MSLIAVLLTIEICGWIAINRITPFTVSRVTIALAITTWAAGFIAVYATLYKPPFSEMSELWLFAFINALLALTISFVSLTREASNI